MRSSIFLAPSLGFRFRIVTGLMAFMAASSMP
jgi:hypothetical protein